MLPGLGKPQEAEWWPFASTPAARIRGLLDHVVYRDLGQLDVAERRRLAGDLVYFAWGGTNGEWLSAVEQWRVKARGQVVRRPRHDRVRISGGRSEWEIPFDELRAIQKAVQAALESLMAPRLYRHTLGTVEIVAAPMRDPGAVLPTLADMEWLTETGGARVFVAGVPLAIRQRLRGSLADGVLVATLTLLQGVPLSLLRRCPYQGEGRPRECGRIFIARKRQKWCVDHQEIVRLERDRAAQRAHRARLRRADRGRRGR